ncbi:MAG: DUF3575 domain-containing protein [Marinifilaceae bacterium]
MRQIFSTLLFTFICTIASGTSQKLERDSIKIHFRQDKSDIDGNYMQNRKAVIKLQRLMEFIPADEIDSIFVIATASPEGGTLYNLKLSERRASQFKSFILSNYPEICNCNFFIQGVGTDWNDFLELVKKDFNVPQQKNVIIALETFTPEQYESATDSKTRKYIETEIWPYLRNAQCIIYSRPMPESFTNKELVNWLPQTLAQTNNCPSAVEKRLYFAIKTNLLYDVIALPNIEFEIPIGKRWSIAANWNVAWWLWEKQPYCYELTQATVEGKYWLGNREIKKQLQGWHVGLTFGGGCYDLGWHNKGYQGEYIIAGAVGGYSHSIGRYLGMEYALGLGYMYNRYREYYSYDDGHILEWRKTGNLNWIGPIKAKVSLVWYITRDIKKGGKR